MREGRGEGAPYLIAPEGRRGARAQGRLCRGRRGSGSHGAPSATPESSRGPADRSLTFPEGERAAKKGPVGALVMAPVRASVWALVMALVRAPVGAQVRAWWSGPPGAVTMEGASSGRPAGRLGPRAEEEGAREGTSPLC